MKTDIAIITCHFNWCGYKNPRDNLLRFLSMYAHTLPIYGVEAYLPGTVPATEGIDNWIQLEVNPAKHQVFQKEALLNLAERMVPQQYIKILLLDADLTFRNPNWFDLASDALDEHYAIQPFTRAKWLDHNGLVTVMKPSAASAPELLAPSFKSHPGFAWGLRRSFWQATGGLYPYQLLGAGDTALAYALFGLPPHPQEWRDEASREHYQAWQEAAREWSQGRVAATFGDVEHSFHGQRTNRGYAKRRGVRSKVNVPTMLIIDDRGLLTWADAAPNTLRDAVKNYFVERQEDTHGPDLAGYSISRAMPIVCGKRGWVVSEDSMRMLDDKPAPAESYIMAVARLVDAKDCQPATDDETIAELEARATAEKRVEERRQATPAVVSAQAFRRALHRKGLLYKVAPHINMLPPPIRAEVEIMWEFCTEFHRTNTEVLLLATSLGMDDEAIDAIFTLAGEIMKA